MKIIYFIEDGLSCTSILRTVKEEVDCCFDIMTKKKTKKKQKQKQKKNSKSDLCNLESYFKTCDSLGGLSMDTIFSEGYIFSVVYINMTDFIFCRFQFRLPKQ